MLLHGLDESEIAHHSGDKGVLLQFSLFFQANRAKSEDPVATDYLTFCIGENHPVRIPFEGDSDVRLMLEDQLTGRFRVKRAAAVVDVEAIRLVAGDDDLRAELLENEWGDEIGGSVSAIDDDF